MTTLLWLMACLKAPTPLQAPEALPVTVAAVVDSYDDATTEPATDRVLKPLLEVVSAHGLVPAEAPVAADARSTEDRLAALGAEGVVVLVELAPRFSSQMTGRYRWTVDARVHLVAPGGEGGERTVEVPVFLYYAHEQEQAAAEAAVPVVAREVSALIEDWIR